MDEEAFKKANQERDEKAIEAKARMRQAIYKLTDEAVAGVDLEHDTTAQYLRDPAKREALLRCILGEHWENFVFAMAEQGFLQEVLSWEEPDEA